VGVCAGRFSGSGYAVHKSKATGFTAFTNGVLGLVGFWAYGFRFLARENGMRVWVKSGFITACVWLVYCKAHGILSYFFRVYIGDGSDFGLGFTRS
jgi:hypothetical protein